MGVRGLFTLINKICPDVVDIVPISKLKGKRIAIDAIIWIYQWKSVGDMRKIRNSRGEFINHIQGIFFRTAFLLRNGIEPIYVFDGKPPASKEAALAARRARIGRIKIGQTVIKDCKYVLNLMGVTAIDAAGEAEAQAAAYTKNKLVAAVATEDSDALAFGAPTTIVGLAAGSKFVKVYHLAKVLRGLGLTYRQFVDMCILAGNDYNLPSMGIMRAYSVIKEYKTIESARNAGIKILPNCESTRGIYIGKIPSVSKRLPRRRPIQPAIIDYLVDIGIPELKIRNALIP